MAAPKKPETEGLTVVELFTSQSCSSCPAADRQLTELAKNPDIITLGFHVTYWDHLSWKDTLGRHFAAERQRAYAAFMRKRGVYTPQMVVNGRTEFVGSNEGKIADALRSAQPLARIGLNAKGHNLHIDLPEIKSGSYTLWLARAQSTYTQAIPKGENRGRTVEYTNAVLDFKPIGQWNGEALQKTASLPDVPGADRYIVFAQKDGLGPIAAAGQFKNQL